MTSSYVELKAADGTVLRGMWWDGSDAWVLLLHDYGQDVDAWRPLRGVLEESGCSRLAVDLRGHGTSDGAEDEHAVAEDIEAMVGFARAEGATKICVVAAGRVGVEALALQRGSPFDAIALLSPGPLGGRDPSELRGAGSRKVFFTGACDPEQASASSVLRQVSIGWSYSASFPSDELGTALLTGSHTIHVKEHLATFIREFAHDSGLGATSAESG